MLGTGDYAVVIADWRARRMVWQSGERTIISATWGRERSEKSKADVKVVAPPHIADAVEPWMHTISLYRGGELVWHGIITRVSATAGVIDIDAADGAEFFHRRRVPLARAWAQHDATQVMRTMVEDACGHADATGLVEGMVTRESRVWITAGWTPSECMVIDAIDELVDQGLVWTVSAGRLLVGPVGSARTTAQLADRDFDGALTVVKDGAGVVTDVHVQGKGVWAQHMVEDSPLGSVQAIEKADSAVHEDEARNVAKRIVGESSVTPRKLVVPSGARLLPSAPVRINELVPGARVPVASTQTGITVAATLAVKEVKVDVDDGGETVNVTLSEIHVTDEVTSMPDPGLIDMRSPYEKELAKSNHSGAGSGAKKDEDPNEIGTAPA